MTEIQQILEAIARLEKAVAELKQERLEQLQPQWQEVAEAAKSLGLSPRQIRARIRDGRWKHGREYVDTSDGAAPRYRVNLSAAAKRVALPPEKRR